MPYLKVLGLLRVLARPVVGALTALDCPAAALVWLANHAENRALRHLIDAIAERRRIQWTRRRFGGLPLEDTAAARALGRQLTPRPTTTRRSSVLELLPNRLA
ncbi:hypothetical protein M2271_002285 [Streptomyces sp. LBL]|uniref:hypothetical protein n=1 Tax=Streptomyces sp. LBL TaxID=2940562 RepID=UPI002474A784|nr:hypothetical protein [Streptomyces sp. LBL]MDH6624483.1 hypothetical protein [Streptomyces sp. LBL]